VLLGVAALAVSVWVAVTRWEVLAGRTDLAVTSVSGSADGLPTPRDIAAPRIDLPPDTRYAVIDGAVHAYFGDYGEQPGDGIPTTDRGPAAQHCQWVTLGLSGRSMRLARDANWVGKQSISTHPDPPGLFFSDSRSSRIGP
jgi:hypothetical protein